MGIEVKPKLDLAKMMAFKDEGVKGNVDGVAFLLRKNKIDHFHGSGRIAGAGEVEVALPARSSRLRPRPSSSPRDTDVAKLRHRHRREGDRILDRCFVPGRTSEVLVVGAGVIGLELGSVWRRLGSDVVVVEFLDRILPGLDGEVARQMQKILTKQGMAFKLAHKVTGIERSGGAQKITIEPAGGGEAETLSADVVLVAIGRVPHTAELGLAEAGVAQDNRGRVVVDTHFRTNVAGVYAIGDVIAGPMLAHKAEDEGIAVAEILAGQAGHVNYDVIPNVIYTFPEVASVGKSEEELKAAGIAYRSGKFPFTANGRAKANKQTDGFVKVLADEATDRVLGVHIIAAQASEMIAEAAVLMEFGGSAEDLARTTHAHPTLTEAVKEAALAVDKRAIHM